MVVTLAVAEPGAAQDRRAQRAAERTALGQALVRAGNPGSATAHFRDAIRIDPAFAPAYLGLAGIYRDAGRFSDALDVLRLGIRRRPRSVPLALLLAEVLAETDRAAAAEVLRDTVRRAPQSVEAHRARGALARERGAFAEAIASYRAVVRLTENAQEPALAEVHEEARRYVAALRLLVRDVDPVGRCEGTPVRRALCGS